MKIVFDSEEQKEQFLMERAGCPSYLGYTDLPRNECWNIYSTVDDSRKCIRCFEQSGIEIEVKEKTDENHI